MTAARDHLSHAKSMHWDVHGLEIAGLCWGPEEGRPVLALHGWMDNAASFALLAPYLEGCHVVALDLTGHGKSAHRSQDASYQIWDDLPEIVGVVDALGWEKFDLVGHSRGAIISSLLASAFPERVGRLVLLDALAPPAVAQDVFPEQLRQAILDKKRLLARELRYFAHAEDAIAVRVKSGLQQVAATLIAERNLVAEEEGFRWSTDARLTGASMVKLSSGQVDAVLKALSMPVQLLVASETSRQHPQLRELARTGVKDLQVLEIEGGHHFHMEEGVDTVAAHIMSFLAGGEHPDEPGADNERSIVKSLT